MKLKGTTLIEILLYFAILSVVLLAGLNFSIQILTVNQLSGDYHEMQYTMDFLGEDMMETIQNATAIDIGNSIFDAAEGKLSLTVENPAKSPTQFYLTNGDLYLKEGAANAVKINSNFVKFTSLNFHRIVTTKAPDQIVINAEIYQSRAESPNLQQTLTFHQTVTLRKL